MIRIVWLHGRSKGSSSNCLPRRRILLTSNDLAEKSNSQKLQTGFFPLDINIGDNCPLEKTRIIITTPETVHYIQ